MSSSSWAVSVVKFASFKGWSLKEEQGPLPSLCMDCHFLNTNMAWLTQGVGGGWGMTLGEVLSWVWWTA